MITEFLIKNFMGIEKECNISLQANNKIKREYNYTKEIDNTNFINLVSFIGNNGSGKTSILKAFATLQTFIDFPSRKSSISSKEFLNNLKKLPDDLIEELLKGLNSLSLPDPNNYNENTIIEIELYIPKNSSEYNIDGFYKYKLIYNKDYKDSGVLEESLNYRKKYNSIKTKEIFKVNNIFESEIGTTLLYENNNLFTKKDNINYYKTFGNFIKNNFVFLFENPDMLQLRETYLIDSFKKNKLLFNSICKIADDKLKYAEIISNNKDENIVFINTKGKKLYLNQLSTGTIKTIYYSNKFYESIKNNQIIFIDELENSLHISLAKFLLNFLINIQFNSYAQIIFTTHNSQILDSLDNDQIYYINNKNNCYDINNISNAIKDGIMNKDKTIKKALEENLLIKNPDNDTINNFFNNIKSNNF